ncbi:MAG: DUF1553 domain-containing protein [Planctomycetaceae bacterium]
MNTLAAPFLRALSPSPFGHCVLMLVALSNVVVAQDLSFDQHVAPILAGHCLECHRGAKPEGGLALFRQDLAVQGGDSGTAFIPGNADQSLLWQRVRDDQMPPKHPLTDDQKAVLKKWIENGAKWGTSPIDPFAFTTTSRAGRDWWALQPLRPVAVPANSTSPSSGNAIDAFLSEGLRQAGLTPFPPATPRALVRRLWFDLIGLPPTPEQVAAFEAGPSPAAYRRLVDELLSSPQYGERWARHWLDVVRYGESDGFERNFPRKNAWHYRDWVINALNTDMPYDEFARQQLCGDLLTGGVDGAAATGFWVAGVHNTVVGGSERMKQLARQDEIEEVLATVGQTFLGLTVNCARCHDHKFDPVSQQEFYQLASAISGLGYGERTEQSPADAAALKVIEQQLKDLQRQRADIDQKARTQILAARTNDDASAPVPPAPFARWEFDTDFNDSIGTLHGKAVGNAKLSDGALMLDGASFVETAVLTTGVQQKTLEAYVQLDDLEQRGGGVLSIQTTDGGIFDAIVYGERDPGQWLAGSNGFARTESFDAPPETETVSQPILITLVYSSDDIITAYRNGLPYGRSIRKSSLQSYAAGQTQLLIGLRHKPGGGNRFLKGKIHHAAFYDRALSPEEVAASAANVTNFVSEKEIAESLPEPERLRREQLIAQITDVAHQRDVQASRANRTMYTLTPGKAAVTRVLLRGDPDSPGEVVAPGAVAAIAGAAADFQLPPDAAEADRRRKLMEWVTADNNPLFARVIVNRIWHYHFGTGLVDTPNDFGFNGGRPSHPELLDWLALRFHENGYQMKDLHRLIVTSDAYQRSGQLRSSGVANSANDPRSIDAGNRLLWRMSPRRLEAEAIRDAMLVVAGQLNSKMGGPGFEDVQTIVNNGTTYFEPIDANNPDQFRRTIYRFTPRGNRSALLETFDCPDPASAAPRRSITTTPLQALSLLNNAFVLRMAGDFAERLEQEAGLDVSQQIQHAWQLALCRPPTPEEQRLSTELVAQHGLPALCRGLFNSNEFVVVE